jgi:hypothetical protein
MTTKTRLMKIAAELLDEVSVSSLFKMIKNEIEDHNKREKNEVRINVVTEAPPHYLKVTGYLKEVAKLVNRKLKNYKDKFTWHVDRDMDSKKLITITVEPRLPVSAEAKFNDSGVAHFVSGPYRGREVSWSGRRSLNLNDLKKKREKEKFIVVPDVWNSSFYGWKEEEK